MKLSQLVRNVALSLFCLGAGNNVANAETTIGFNPSQPSRSNVQSEYQLGDCKAALRLNDPSLAPYFLRKEGPLVAGGDVEFRNVSGSFERRTNSRRAGIRTKMSRKIGPAYFELQPNLSWTEFGDRSDIGPGAELRINSYPLGFFIKNYLKDGTTQDDHWYESKIGRSTERGTVVVGYRDHDTPSIERLKHIFAYADCSLPQVGIYGLVDQTLTNGYTYTELGADFKPSDNVSARLTKIWQKARGYPSENLFQLEARVSPLTVGLTQTETGELLPYASVDVDLGDDVRMKATYGVDEIRSDLDRNRFAVSLTVPN